MIPEVIDNTDFRVLKVDNKYCVSLVSRGLPSNIYFLDIVKDIDKNLEVDYSFFISKLDPQKALNNITYNLSANLGELSSIKSTQRNIDIISKANEDSVNLRKKIQLENQEIYNFSLLLTFYSTKLENLFLIVSKFKARMYSRGVVLDTLNFRHLEGYFSNLPTNNNCIDSNQYITTSALANIFPYYSLNIIDENGVEIGYTKPDGRLCIVDMFSDKYNNSNMCIFGSSGSGKSFFTKLLILRNFFLNKFQIVLDIENEYESLCENLSGNYIFKNCFFNPFRITENDIAEFSNSSSSGINSTSSSNSNSNYLDKKISKIIQFISEFYTLSTEEKATLEYYILEVYLDYGITKDIESIFVKDGEKINMYRKEIISSFPTFLDLSVKLSRKDIKMELRGKIERMSKYFREDSNLDFKSNLFILDMSKIKREKRMVEYILRYILENLDESRETIIYIDEVWKYAKSKESLEALMDMYKTIRKRYGSIVTITQDITDFFEFENGRYAKSILNNSAFKVVFKIEYADKEQLSKVVSADVSILQKGEAYLVVNNSCSNIKIVANEFEEVMISENYICNR